MSEALTVKEAYMSARTANSLALRSETTRSPVDVLTSAGMVGRRSGLALSLWAVMHKPSRTESIRLADMLANRLERHMEVKRIKAKEHALQIARLTLAWWLDGICPHCNGVGEKKIEGTPHLSGIACDHCGGSGRDRLVTPNDDCAQWLLQEISALELSAEDLIRKKLR